MHLRKPFIYKRNYWLYDCFTKLNKLKKLGQFSFMYELCLKKLFCERIELKIFKKGNNFSSTFFAFPPLHVTGNWCKRLHRWNHITETEMLMFALGFLTEKHHRPARSDWLVLQKNSSLHSCITTFFQAEVNQLNQTGNLVHHPCNQREAIALKMSGLDS